MYILRRGGFKNNDVKELKRRRKRHGRIVVDDLPWQCMKRAAIDVWIALHLLGFASRRWQARYLSARLSIGANQV